MPDNRVTLTMKIDPRLMERIDTHAAREGENRTQYVLRWLPAYYEWKKGDTAADTTRRINESAGTRCLAD